MGGLRGPYASQYGYAQRIGNNTMNNNQSQTNLNEDSGNEDNNNNNKARKGSYEDKMDKQRLEHILFSGEQSGPLNVKKYILLTVEL